jgi:signal transduction histidine kinase
MNSLQTRLRRRLLVGFLLVGLVLGLAVRYQVNRQLGEFLDYQLEQVARALILSDLQGTGQTWDDDPALHLDVQIWDAQGKRLYRSSELIDFGPDTPNGLSLIRSGPQGDAVLLKVFTLRNFERTVQVMHAKALRDDLRLDAVLDVMLPALLVLAIGAWLVGVPVKQGLAPLRDLTAALSQRRVGAMQPLELPQAPTELAPVIDTFNRLLLQLDASLQAHKRFIADAAHELRTPVTALGLEVSNLAHAPSAEQVQQSVQRLQRGVARAQHLMRQMLTLARLEARTQPKPQQPVDLAVLVQQALMDLSALAIHRGIEFELDAPDRLCVLGDADDLRLLLDNLLSNAMKFSPAQASVTVGLSTSPAPARLRIRDQGPGMPPALRQRLGQPFVRADSAVEGAGLGLSIALEVARTQGVAVAFEDPTDGLGLCVVVDWPASATFYEELPLNPR